MSRSEFSFAGRLDAHEAASALALVGRASSGDRVVRASLSAPATDASRAAANDLMVLIGTRRTLENVERFPVAVRCAERRDRPALVVELHPLMRERDALAELVGHLVGGVAGRLVRRIWGRWGETFDEPTDQLLDAVGASHMRFTQFAEEVLRTGLTRARAACGLTASYTTVREGRGAKVVRVNFSVGPAPTWIGAEEDGAPAVAGAEAAHALLPAADRGALYAMVHSAMGAGRTLPQAFAWVRDWLTASGSPEDARLAAAADACAGRGGFAPAATAMERVLLGNAHTPACALQFLSRADGPWPDASRGKAAARAWMMRAVACLASDGAAPGATARRLRAAIAQDETAGVIAAEDAEAVRETLAFLAETLTEGAPGPVSAASLLGARDRFRLVAAGEAGTVSEVLEELAVAMAAA